jgi:DNA-binding CsgD family transcriptional regulator
VTFEEITPEFIIENQKQLCQTMPISKKGGGPYSKQDKQARQNEVYRYHFEYGYSARKIAELMKINRNTINGDITHWYSIISNSNDIQPEPALFTILERRDIQRTRTREYLDKTSNISEKITIEKMILDIDYKIAQIN